MDRYLVNEQKQSVATIRMKMDERNVLYKHVSLLINGKMKN